MTHEQILLALLSRHCAEVCRQAGAEFREVIEPVRALNLPEALVVFNDRRGRACGLFARDFNIHSLTVTLNASERGL